MKALELLGLSVLIFQRVCVDEFAYLLTFIDNMKINTPQLLVVICRREQRDKTLGLPMPVPAKDEQGKALPSCFSAHSCYGQVSFPGSI